MTAPQTRIGRQIRQGETPTDRQAVTSASDARVLTA